MSKNSFPRLGALVRRYIKPGERVELGAGQDKTWRVQLGEGDNFAFDAIRGKRRKHQVTLKDEEGNIVARGRRSIVIANSEPGKYFLTVTNGSTKTANMKYQVDRFRNPRSEQEPDLSVRESIAPNTDINIPAENNQVPGAPVTPVTPVDPIPTPLPQLGAENDIPGYTISLDPGVFTVIDAVTVDYLFDGGAFDSDRLYIEEIGTGERTLILDDATDAALFSALHENSEPVFNMGAYQGQRHVPTLAAGDTFKLLVERNGVIISDSTLNPEEFAVSSRHAQPMMIGTEDIRNGDNDFNDLLVQINGVVGGNVPSRASFGSVPV